MGIKNLKPAMNDHICLVAISRRCFIRRSPAQDDQDDQLWMVPRVVILYRSGCMILTCAKMQIKILMFGEVGAPESYFWD